jgi:hypothetical protein
MSDHNTYWIPTASTILTHAQTIASSLTTVTSHLDGWKSITLNTQHKPELNILETEDLKEDSRLHG